MRKLIPSVVLDDGYRQQELSDGAVFRIALQRPYRDNDRPEDLFGVTVEVLEDLTTRVEVGTWDENGEWVDQLTFGIPPEEVAE